MTELTRLGKGWRYYAGAAAMTVVVFLTVRGCVYEYGVQDALRERAQAEIQAEARQAEARISRKHAGDGGLLRPTLAYRTSRVCYLRLEALRHP